MSTLNIQLLGRTSKKKKDSLNYRNLLPDLASGVTLSGLNYPCLEQFPMVPKMFEPLKFDCIRLILLSEVMPCLPICRLYMFVCFFF